VNGTSFLIQVVGRVIKVIRFNSIQRLSFIFGIALLVMWAGILKGETATAQSNPFPGNPPIAPYWVLEHGVWEDNTNTQTSTQNLVNGYLSRNIPVSWVIIDSPWATHYNSFVFDSTRYPNPQQMINDFHSLGVRVMLWVTGFVNNDSPDYAFVKQMGYGVHNNQDFNWWWGRGVHIDFTNPQAKNWWHSKMDLVLSMGIDGWKVDMSGDYVADPVITSIGTMSRQEFKLYYYADFHDYSTSVSSHIAAMARPYSFQGGIGAPVSKLPVGWTGDYQGGFRGISDQMRDVYESALRGYGVVGVEVGGYWEVNPTKRSLIRYAQFGALAPMMENGGRNGGENEHLPWRWDTETVDIYRYYATLHNELAPYYFSYGVESNQTGRSVIRDPNKDQAHHKVGEEIFTSLIVTDGADTATKQVLFPAGARWIDYWNEDQVYEGSTSISYTVPLARFPIFIKTGAIIPMNVRNNITGHGDATSEGKVTLQIYPSGTSSFNFRRPLGAGTEWTGVQINVNETNGTIQVQGSRAASYRLRVKSFTQPTSVSGADSWRYDTSAKTIIIDKQGSSFTITVNNMTGYGDPPSPSPLITDLVVSDTPNAGNWSIRTNLQTGDRQYGDRTFTWTSIGGGLSGADWIRTANDSKFFTGNTLVTFKVTRAAEVFIAHRDDITNKPSWLNDWTNTGIRMVNSEPKNHTVFRKNFPAGATVSLGNNGNTSSGMYSIIVRALPDSTPTPLPTPTRTPTPTPPSGLISNLVVSDSANAVYWSVRGNLQTRDRHYGDREFTISQVEGGLTGSEWIRTANNSKSYTGATLVSFRVNQNADVYVAHRDDISPKPSWMSGWTNTGHKLINSEPHTWTLFRRTFSAGTTVSLGNNGSTHSGMYTIIVKPSSSPTPTATPTNTQPPTPTHTPSRTATPLSSPTPTSSSALIYDMVVFDSGNASRWSIRTNIQVGDVQFGDRTFTFTSIGGSLSGSDWIRTANDSKFFTGATLVSFRVSQNADVFVAHRDDINPKPSWLSGWTNTGQKVINSEPRDHTLYHRTFSAGSTVSLGSNGSTQSGMYTIIVRPAVSAPPTPTSAPPSPTPTHTSAPPSPTPTRTSAPPSPTPTRTATPVPSPTPVPAGLITELVVQDTANAANWFIRSNIKADDQQYGDRNFTIVSLTSPIVGADWVRTANDSKQYTGAVLVTFRVTQSATVYVAHRDDISTKPGWLSTANGWTQSSERLHNNEPHSYTLYAKTFPANSTVSLGNNGDSIRGMYTIIVKP
jgi:hypothetical protein